MRKKLLFALLLATGLYSTSNAQTTGDYRSVASGNWGTSTIATAIWETYDGSNWVPTAIVPSSAVANTVTIRSGHTVTLNATSSVKDLVIESGAVFKSGLDASSTAATRNIRLVGTITNNGTFGSTTSTDRVSIEGYATNGTMTVTGNGSYYVNVIRCNGIVENVSLVIDANIDMNSYISGFYTNNSGTNSALQENDNVNIIINPGKTVKGGAGSYLHFNSTSIATDLFGVYTYTINGTLDFSAATTTTSIVEHSTKADRNVTVNVNGTWKLGAAGFRGISNATTLTPSNTVLNVSNTGVVDASLVNNFVFKNATTGEVAFFNITGNGVLKQNPAAGTGTNTTTAFIGSNNVYSPVVFTGAGATGVYTLNVQNAADNGKNVVKKQWTVTAPAGASGVTLNFGWLPADQANAFNPASPLIYNYASPNWNTINASGAVAGSGTAIAPYAISTEALSTFGTFMIGNETPTGVPLPLDLVSFSSKAISNAVKLSWVTANEDKVKGFELERQAANGVFENIATISAKNQKALQEYSFVDYGASAGVNYYRLKMIDLDGAISYSSVVSTDVKSSVKLSAYPNPASGASVTIEHPAGSNRFDIFGSNGVVQLTGKIAVSETATILNIGSLASGVYYVKFNKSAAAVSFIKQ